MGHIYEHVGLNSTTQLISILSEAPKMSHHRKDAVLELIILKQIHHMYIDRTGCHHNDAIALRSFLDVTIPIGAPQKKTSRKARRIV